MPIRADLRHFYRGPEWEATRKRILARAGDCCEGCGCPDREFIVRRTWKEFVGSWENAELRSRMIWRRADSVIPTWRDEKGEIYQTALLRSSREARKSSMRLFVKTIYVVLGIAHLNNTAGDDRDENLRAWCGWCHLHHDQPHHQETREVRKDSGRPMLQEGEARMDCNSAITHGGKY